MPEQTYRLVTLVTTPDRDTVSHVQDVIEATLRVQMESRDWEVDVVHCERLVNPGND
jgi:hypothetical protein